MPDTNGASRLDRIEEILDKHTQEIALLLEHGRQVDDSLNKSAKALERVTEVLLRLAEAQNRLTEAHMRLELAQAETTEKLNALIAVVDDLVRHRGGQQPL